MALRSFFGFLDRRVRRILDRVLPENLTTRYVLGLAVIAGLASSGQILIQLSLVSQQNSQKLVRLLDRQTPALEEIKKTALSIQLSSSANEIIHGIDTISAAQARLDDARNQLTGNPAMIGAPAPLHAVNTELGRIREISAEIRKRLSDFSDQQYVRQLSHITPLANEILESSFRCESALGEVTQQLEQRLDRQVRQFERIEFFLFLGTILVLIFEALYVFRPAVRRLYEALHVRSNFLSRMSHELRNPMNAIIGMADLLAATSVNEQQANYLTVLRRSGSGLLEMLNSLLDFSGMETGRIVLEQIDFDLLEVLERCIDFAVPASEANRTELLLDIAPEVPLRVIGDPVRIQQVLSNLIGNAAKFTKSGYVTLSVKRKEGNLIHFAVSDTGIGIEKENLDRIFDAFVQADTTIRRLFGGTGLGLTISKDLVAKMGGKLEVKSEKDRGSCFSFSLPLEGEKGSELAIKIEELDLVPFQAVACVSSDLLYAILQGTLSRAGGTLRRIHGIREEEVSPGEVLLVDTELLEASGVSESRLSSKTVLFAKNSAAPAEVGKWIQRFPGKVVFQPLKPLQILHALQVALTGTGRALLPGLARDTRELKVLVADDSIENHALIRGYLESQPYLLSFAQDGRAAVDRFKSEEFDIVLMDLEMPVLDGHAATHEIRDWERKTGRKPTPIIVVSAYQPNEKPVPEATRRLTKPLRIEPLLRTIRDVTGGTWVKEVATKEDPIKALERKLLSLGPKYLEDRRKDLVVMKKSLETKDFDTLRTLGHRMRGNALSYGFAKLGELGKKLEEAVDAGDEAQINASVAEIEEFILQQQPIPVS